MPVWHPKVTPYRLLVVCSTITLGTWKAIVTQNQNTTTSIALEWIGGTVLAIMRVLRFHILSLDRIPNLISNAASSS